MKLELKNINKSFDDNKILHDVTFSVESGKAMGFLGRNGAGKTTTIRVLMDVFKADSGEILVDGKPFKRENFKIGYLPEERGMYQKISLIDQLTYLGVLKGMDRNLSKQEALKWLERMELSEYANKNLETLSKGNQQKVQILQAVIDDPDIVVFDEPFSGLDPVNSLVLQEIIQEFIDKGRIVIFSSHQMGQVEQFCDDVTFIKKGRIIESGNLKEIKSRIGKNNYRIYTSEQEISKLSTLENITNIDQDSSSYIVELKPDYTVKDLLKDIVNLDMGIVKFEPYRPSLQEIFINLDKEF